jgi:ketosteroid isomerase-like protein
MIGAIILKMGAKRGWAAINRRDLEPLLKYVTDESVLEVPGRPPWGGRFVGKEAWRAWFDAWYAAVATFEYRVLREALANPYALGFSNTVLTEFEIDATTHDGRTWHGRGIDVSEMRSGKYVVDRTYMFDPETNMEMLAASAPPAVAPEPAHSGPPDR